MEPLIFPDNLKVHWAACETMNQYLPLEKLGVNYGLFTAYPFVERMMYGKKKAKCPIMPLRWMTNPAVEIPQYVCSRMKHVIQDSGIFTLMFGSQQGKKDENTVGKWYDNLVEFTLNHGCNVTCVEIDCQKILSVEKAWEFRERMRKDLPNNRIINVFHTEDGQYGLDRLIEYSDYIGIGLPELRAENKTQYVPALVEYIRKKKPTIDIHLLGCTDKRMLQRCKFCTSSDSTSWKSGLRYGWIEDYHISDILTEKVISLVGPDIYNFIREYNNETNTNYLCLQVEMLKQKYQSWCGNQDYRPWKNQ